MPEHKRPIALTIWIAVAAIRGWPSSLKSEAAVGHHERALAQAAHAGTYRRIPSDRASRLPAAAPRGAWTGRGFRAPARGPCRRRTPRSKAGRHPRAGAAAPWPMSDRSWVAEGTADYDGAAKRDLLHSCSPVGHRGPCGARESARARAVRSAVRLDGARAAGRLRHLS